MKGDAMSAPVQPVTGPQVPVEFPPAPPDEPLYEVVNGRRVELPPMSTYATVIASFLQDHLGPHARANSLGLVVTETLFVLDPVTDLRRRPDVAFVSPQRWPLDREIPEEGDWAVVPDLAVEVISPNDLFQPVMAKWRGYFQYGVRQVWLVIPGERLVYVYDSVTAVRILSESDELDLGPLLPGLRLSLAQLFRRTAR
jgi:Uma2 family endonuclease